MNASYECLQVLRLHGNKSGTIQDTTEITSGNTPVAWDEYGNNSNIACLKFVPNKSSDNLSVTFTINLSYAQTTTGEYWCCGIYEDLPTTTKISSPGAGLYFKFGLNKGSYGDKVKSFTFTGNFKAGKTYWLVVGMASFTTKNTGSLINPNSIVLTAENVSGATAYIWTTIDEDAHESVNSAGFSAQQRYTSTNGVNSGWSPANWVMPENTNNICGGGLNNTANGCLIPIPAADFNANSLTWRAKIYKSPSGVDTFRWAITKATQDECAAYVNGKNVDAVTEPKQIASGTFHPDWDAGKASNFEMSIDFSNPVPANTPLNLVLWGTSQSYGNIHIQSAVTTILRSVALSGMGFVPHTPYVWTDGAWREMLAQIYSNGSWES